MLVIGRVNKSIAFLIKFNLSIQKYVLVSFSVPRSLLDCMWNFSLAFFMDQSFTKNKSKDMGKGGGGGGKKKKISLCLATARVSAILNLNDIL
jgi:hypothetical protein